MEDENREERMDDNMEESRVVTETTSQEPVTASQEPGIYSPLYVPKQEKKNNHLTFLLVILLVFFLVIGLIAAVSKLVKSAMVEVGESALNGRSITSRIESMLKEYQNSRQTPKDDETFSEPDEDDEYIPSAEDPYYVCLADATRDDLSYGVKQQDYSYSNEDDNLYITITYPEITGDTVKNQTYLNDSIESAATYYQKNFANHPENGTVSDCQIWVNSYVTYMSEDILSVVLSENLYLADMGQVDLYCINIDIATGQILNNTQILSYSEELAKEFRKISNKQNGAVDAVSELSDEEIVDYLSDSGSGIIFYTPVGLEIGYNYSVDSSSGWITATIKDYQKYISKM